MLSGIQFFKRNIEQFDILSGRVAVFRTALLGTGDALRNLRQNLLRLTLAGGGLAWAFNREFIGTADTFERLKISLTAIEGSAEAAGRSMKFLRDITVETPYEMEDLAKAFRILRGFGLDPTNGTLRAITDQVAKLGGTGEDLTGIALQLGQAFSKERLQAQDANILVERGVPVWALLQRAAERMGKSIPIARLRQMSEQGKLGQNAVLDLIRQMGVESEGASRSMMKSWSGMLSNLRDQWTFFKLKVMESGPFQWLKDRLQGLLDLIDRMSRTGELDALAGRVGGQILEFLKELWRFGGDVWQVLKGVGGALKWVADLFGSWRPVLLGVVAILAAPLVASLITVTAALWGVASALGAVGLAWLSTPFGQAAAVIMGIVAAVGLAIRYWDKLKQAVSGFFEMFRGKSLAGSIGGAVGSALVPGLGGLVGRTAGNLVAGGAPTGAAAIRPAPAATAAGNSAEVTVRFENAPPGLRVKPEANTGVPLNLDLGYAMGGP